MWWHTQDVENLEVLYLKHVEVRVTAAPSR